MPGYTGKQVSDNWKTSQQDPTMKANLRKTNFVMGDPRLRVLKSTMNEQFPVLENPTDFEAEKKKQKALVLQLRSTQFSIGDGTPVEYRKTSEMKDWSDPATYERPRSPLL
jgi:hypothetical protein